MSRTPDRTVAKIDEAIAIATKNGRRKESDGIRLLRKLRELIASGARVSMKVDGHVCPIGLNDITVRKTVLEVDLTKYDLGIASFTPGEVHAEYRENGDACDFIGYGVPANDERDCIVDFDRAA